MSQPPILPPTRRPSSVPPRGPRNAADIVGALNAKTAAEEAKSQERSAAAVVSQEVIVSYAKKAAASCAKSQAGPVIAGISAFLIILLLALSIFSAFLMGGGGVLTTPPESACVAPDGGGVPVSDGTKLGNAKIIIAVAANMGLPRSAADIGVMTALTESGLVNVNFGDADSVGLFQQRPSQGWGTVEQIMDPEYSSRKFFTALKGLNPKFYTMKPWEAAQKVQRSAFANGSNYAKQYPTATSTVETILAQEPSLALQISNNAGNVQFLYPKLNTATAAAPTPSPKVGTVSGFPVIKETETELVGMSDGSTTNLPRRVPVANPTWGAAFGEKDPAWAATGGFHTGQDFPATKGTPVFATTSGVVKKVSLLTTSYGKHVVIAHAQFGAKKTETLYAHMSEVLVKEGQQVTMFTQIGKVGSTGNANGNHLHFEVSENGTRTDPRAWLNAAGGSSSGSINASAATVSVAPWVGSLFSDLLTQWQMDKNLGGGKYSLDKGKIVSYQLRYARNGAGLYSDHAGYAVDLRPDVLKENDPSMTEDEVSAVERILKRYEGMLSWGGDYATNTAEAHFYVTPGVTPEMVAAWASTGPQDGLCDGLMGQLDANGNFAITGAVGPFKDGVQTLPGGGVAVARSNSFVGNPPCQNKCIQLCDKLAGLAWGYGNSGYASAKVHWGQMVASGHAHPGNRQPPLGALLFWDPGNAYGHVSVYVGDGKVVSNLNGPQGDNVYKVPAKYFEDHWNATYLGWSDPVFAGAKL
jgi:murein DD-endopeptidase MepM/ murein hydrolase activator NlpD